jgi:hypothetical protein
MDRLKKLEVRMLEAPDQQISLTDPDARSMATSGRGSGMVGYNVQTAVDAKHHLIVAHEVSNHGTDKRQLHNMAIQAKEAIGTDHLRAVADRGYFRGEDVMACDASSITTYLPKPFTSASVKKGLFSKRDFIYHPDDDEYECPAGERLTWRFRTEEAGQMIDKYWTSSCTDCSVKAHCTTSKYRRVARWEHEEVIGQAHQRAGGDGGDLGFVPDIVQEAALHRALGWLLRVAPHGWTQAALLLPPADPSGPGHGRAVGRVEGPRDRAVGAQRRRHHDRRQPTDVIDPRPDAGAAAARGLG